MTSSPYDAAVVGAGPAGLTAAVALAMTGCRTVLAGPQTGPARARPDTRTTALLQASVKLLENLGVWPACRDSAAPLRSIRIIDDTGRLLRAPEVMFRSEEIGNGPFGYNIANTALTAALSERAAAMPNLDIVPTAGATAVEPSENLARITLAEGGAITARIAAGADGRNSLCRAAAQIATTRWSYEQSALACNFAHTEPHGEVSNEFHREAGPFTTVPLPGRISSLVWVERPDTVEHLLAMPDQEFTLALEERLHGLLGRVRETGPRAAFALSGLQAHTFAARRIALVGEAAHVIPPIGAQGLNLGFRDAAVLAELAGKAVAAGGDPGGGSVLAAYNRARRADIVSRTLAVDMLNRSLVTDFVPLQAARGLALHLMNGIGPLRRYVMREGLAAHTNLPELMRAP